MRSIIREDGYLVEVPPERCPAGHRLRPRGVLVGWSLCGCTRGHTGHRTYSCRFLVDGSECGLVVEEPPCVDPGARAGPWALLRASV